MAQSSSSGLERLRQRFPGFTVRPTPAVRQLVEQKLRTQRREIDELAVQGKFGEALLLENENFKDLIDLYGKENLGTIHSMENIWNFGVSCGACENGEEILDRVIELRTKAQGEKHPDTLASIASKVGFLHLAGRTEEAERLGLECAKTCRENLKPEDLATLRVISNLGSIYTSKGDLDNAEKLCLEVLEIRLRTLPYDDIDTVKSKVNLSGVYFSQKRWTDATLLLESVLTTRRRTLGDGHASTIRIASQLEYAYEQLERWKDVQTVQLLILEATKKKLGDEHDETVDVMKTLILNYIRSETWYQASGMIQEVLNIRKKKKPFGDPEIPKMESLLEAVSSKIRSRECQESVDFSLMYQPLNNSGMDPYVYKDLIRPSSFRLLKVFPGEFESPLRCSLFDILLDDKIQYEALSYVWGDLNDREPIACNERQILATRNCSDAIRHLRLPTHARTVWIDAICINQNSVAERNRQVRLMGKIYQHASKVVVWLGREIDDTHIAFKLLSKLKAVKLKHELELLSDLMAKEFFPTESEGPSPLKNYTPLPEVQYQRQIAAGLTSNGLILHMGEEERESLPGFNSPHWKALDALLTRPWFNRVWVLQEVIVSQDTVLICGQRSICWEDFSLAIYCMKDLLLPICPVSLPPTPIWIQRYRNQRQANDQLDLLDMLFTTAALNCTDQRDRVYGLLGMLNHDTLPSLPVDYDLSLQKVFTNTAISLLRDKGNLGVLAAVRMRKLCPNLPSWVPDWTALHASPHFSSRYTWYQASGRSTKLSRVKVSDDGLSITISSAFVASINALSEPMPSTITGDSSDDLYAPAQGKAEAFEQWREFALTADLGRTSTQPYGHTREEAFWRTLVCDLNETMDAPAHPSLQYNYEHLYSKFKAARKGLYSNQVPWLEDPLKVSGALAMTLGMSDPDAKKFINATTQLIGTRLAIVKPQGWFGIVPDNAQVGDSICIFNGGKVPFVVRREGRIGGVLVGPCFVHGLMDGGIFEAVKGSLGLLDVHLR